MDKETESIVAEIKALLADYKTTLYTNVSRIKKKITDKLGKKAAFCKCIRHLTR